MILVSVIKIGGNNFTNTNKLIFYIPLFKNNIKNDFRIPSGLCLLSLKDVLSAMSEAETRTTENLFRLAKLIHNFITHHHDNGVI